MWLKTYEVGEFWGPGSTLEYWLCVLQSFEDEEEVHCTTEVEVFMHFQAGSDMLCIIENTYNLFTSSVNDRNGLLNHAQKCCESQL
jgi:hypothetical protein